MISVGRFTGSTCWPTATVRGWVRAAVDGGSGRRCRRSGARTGGPVGRALAGIDRRAYRAWTRTGLLHGPCRGGSTRSCGTGRLGRGRRQDRQRRRETRADPPAARLAALAENPGWSLVDAENSVQNRLKLDVERVTALLRTDPWDLPALVAQCPVPVHLLIATRTALFSSRLARRFPICCPMIRSTSSAVGTTFTVIGQDCGSTRS